MSLWQVDPGLVVCMNIQTLPFAELCRWILEGEAAVHALPEGQERDMRAMVVRELRSRLPLYAEHRWAVRAWNEKKRRGRGPGDGPIVA